MKKLSLVRSLLLFTMLTSGVGVMLFCAGFLVFDLHTFREKKMNDLKSPADLLRANANSALGFAHSEAGSRVVEAMRVRSGIRTRQFCIRWMTRYSPGMSGEILPACMCRRWNLQRVSCGQAIHSHSRKPYFWRGGRSAPSTYKRTSATYTTEWFASPGARVSWLWRACYLSTLPRCDSVTDRSAGLLPSGDCAAS